MRSPLARLLPTLLVLFAANLAQARNPAQAASEPGPDGVDIAAPTRVACVGDSITYGSGLPDRERTTYPLLLGHLLGEGYEVRNFGVSGATLLRAGNKPWTETGAALRALEWRPEVVVIKLGTNDSKAVNWLAHGEDFEANARALIGDFREASPAARILLCLPVPAWTAGDGIDGGRVAEGVVPALRRAAAADGVELIDLHTPMRARKGWFPDGVHPNPHGAEAIAQRVAEAVLMERDVEYSLRSMLHFMSNSVETGDFHGYTEYRFQKAGAACRVVFPRAVAAGQPWVWRARFWGHEPQFDLAMLERGWHVVYCDVAGLYGNGEALERWDAFHWLLTKSGLSERPLLEGMSRGGLAIYQWAKAHPDQVLAIYGDNPVCDPRSWPGGAGASERREAEWAQCLEAHGLDGSETSPFAGFALDELEGLAAREVPILHVVGEADSVVPVSENSDLVEAYYSGELGGPITVIRKPDQDHHPHGLPNPQPIVDFAQRAAGLHFNPCVVPQPSVEWRGGPAGWGGGTWWQQHEAINALGAANPDLQVVFLGDSITQSLTGAGDRLARDGGQRPIDRFYGERKAASFGLSGDRTEHLLWRIENGNFDALDPRLIVLMIGVNNINAGRNSGEDIAAGIEAVVRLLRQREPQAELLLLGCFPTKEAGSWERRQWEILQQLLFPLGELDQVTYLDLRHSFVDADGQLSTRTMSADGIHLSPTGYVVWLMTIEDTVRRLLGEPATDED